MTAYTAIADSDIDPESPGTTTLFTRLRDNPIAITEGSSGAPNIQTAALADGAVTTQKLASDEQMTTTNVLARTAAGNAGAIGTYVWASSTTATDGAFGSTRAGSSLTPTASPNQATDSGGTKTFQATEGTALSGTWRCMGEYDHSFGSTNYDVFGATLWMRIS